MKANRVGPHNRQILAHSPRTWKKPSVHLSPLALISEGIATEDQTNVSKKPSNTEILVDHAGRGDHAAGQELLVRFQDRLMRMVAVRLDRRLAGSIRPTSSRRRCWTPLRTWRSTSERSPCLSIPGSGSSRGRG